MTISTQNKRLVKNTGFLYVRMIILMLIGFYTSRVVLEVLGVDDYGIYNLVGGIVASLQSIRILFSSSIQRFLNVAIGENNEQKTQNVINGGFILNAILSIIILILLLTVGVWFLHHKLVIPPHKMYSATIVLYLSIAAASVSIFTSFQEGIVISYERMDFYAFISLLDGLLKLLILYLLYILPGDKLIIYGTLMLSIAIFNITLYSIYCKKKLMVRVGVYRGGKNLLKEMGKLSGWNFLGNIGFSIANEGVNFLLNIFGGVVLNAARGIANQLSAVVTTFVGNITTSVRPQIMQSHGANDKIRLNKLINFSCRIMYYFFIILAIPIFIWTEPIMQIWLTDIPPYSISFVKCILVYNLIRPWHTIVNMYYVTIAQMKTFQIIELLRSALIFIGAWILLKNEIQPYVVFLYMAVVEFINLLVTIQLTHHYGETPFTGFYKYILIPCLFVSAICVGASMFLSNLQAPTLLLIGLSIIVNIFVIYLFGLNKKEKGIIVSFAKNKIQRIQKK